MRKYLKSGLAAIGMFVFCTTAAGAEGVHTVKQGETLWQISTNNAVSVLELMEKNDLKTSEIRPGQSLALPEADLSVKDRELLARLVHAEAKGEPYAGKVAVATVVLNRVDSNDFPDTLKDVIYQVANGHYAFSPVQNGQIYNTPSDESRKAVNEALAFKGQGKGSLFFYNPETSSSSWITSRDATLTIGNHVFAK
ncbi:cell wall hydrolase [Rossellomorea aquimaris]|uniref:cell wall hydrolase n=1 Tax=Rossellomorea aquimaris TaxID=189382 RepID=UPI001CD5D7DB|nr:cell wall hydrolase [Rossellomorea aquimaris]MCA1056640.1 cell wall hydrolase [Rossellomorea aquimaris]